MTQSFLLQRPTSATAGLAARLLCVLLLCLTALPAFARSVGRAAHAPDTVRVAAVVDGDTLRLADGRSLRLAGIDTPELGHGKGPDQYFAREARELLQELTQGQTLTLRAASEEGRDRHKRVLAEVLLANGTSLNQIMVAKGAAMAYWHKDLHPAFWNRMLQAQREALRAQRGMWKKMLHHAVGRQRYVGNRHSLRLFPATCAEAANIHSRNSVPFDSLQKALEEGFAPARVCLFWPEG